MTGRRPMGVQDALWLEMDRPTNLMVVDSLLWTAAPLDWDRVTDVVTERLWDRYPVFRSVAVHDDGRWWWQEDAEASIDARLARVRLAQPGGDRELQQLVGARRTVALDRSQPLWEMVYVDGFRGGSAVLTRTHHAIADGIRMVQLAMSLFDAAPEGGAILPPPVTNGSTRSSPGEAGAGQRARRGVEAAAGGVAHVVGGVSGALGQAIGDPGAVVRAGVEALGSAVSGVADAAGRSVELATGSITNPVGAVHGAAASAAALVQRAVRPRDPWTGPLVDLLSSSSADVDVARKLVLGTRNDSTIWTGRAGTRKVVAWSEPLPLRAVKDVARAHGATVNDVLVTCVAGALHGYLTNHDARCASVSWMIPVNLKALDLSLPEDLGNEFALVQLELPTGTSDPLEVLDVVRHRMTRIKHGHEAAIAFRLQEVISGFGDVVYRAAVDLLANRAVGVLTNVPGPPFAVYLAGRRVDGMVGWAPLSGNQPMSFTIYSYDGQVFVGVACDAGLVPDHEQIVDGFAPAFQRLAGAIR